MRKILILIALIFTLILGACSGEPANEPLKETDPPLVEDDMIEEDPIEVEEEADSDLDLEDLNPFANISDMKEYYYEIETIIKDVSVFNTEFWVSGNKSRMESKYPETGEHIIMIMDGDEEVTYMHMPKENMTMIMDYSSDLSSVTPDDEGNIDYIDAMKDLSDDENVTIEKGTLDGEKVQIITGEIMGNKNIIWVSTKTGFPLKSEYYEDGALASTSLFKGFNNKPVDQALFNPPEGTQVMDLRQNPQ